MTAVAGVGTRVGLGLRGRVGVAREALDPSFGAALARRWVAGRMPGATVHRTRTHSALYRGGDDLSVRVGVVLQDPPAGAELTLLVRIRSGALTTTAFPEDPSLPTLPALLDAGEARRVFVTALPGFSARPPTSVEPRLVHHPRAGACVLRYVVDGGAQELYAKVYPSAVEARAVAGALAGVGVSRLSDAGATPTVRLPRLLGLDAEHRVVFLESLGSGQPTGEVRPALAAQVLRSLHAVVPASPPAYVPPRIEVARVHAELVLARTIWPDLADAVALSVTRAAASLAGTVEGPVVLCHGDFTPSQLIALPDGASGLVDLDTLRMAEAASDLGHFLAYAELDLLRRAGASAAPGSDADAGLAAAAVADSSAAIRREVHEELLSAYGTGTRGIPPAQERVRAYRALSLAMTALRSARRFKDKRVQLALALLDDTNNADGGTR